MTKQYKHINGVDVEMTATEITEQETRQAEQTVKVEAQQTALAKNKTDAKEGNDKLIALGLTQDQVTAMTGYTPPSE